MKKKIFFIIWGDPKFYQTLIFLAKHFSNENYKVFIFAKKPQDKEDIIEKIDFGKNSRIFYSPKFLNFLPNIFNFFLFIFYCLFNFISKKPENIIFFNKYALFCLALINFFKRKKNKFIYHNFDFDIFYNIKNIKGRFLSFLEIYLSKFCDYLIFPSMQRAKIFKKVSKNNKDNFFEFKNCFPRNFMPKKSNHLEKFLIKHRLKNKKIICHLGSIGPSHFIEQILDSGKYIQNEFIIIIAGSPIDRYQEKLKKKIDKLNLSKKIYIFENIKNSLWFEILFKSSLGLCFYEKSILSHSYMAGTSQKFNNYLLANIPMIVNNNKDFLEFKKKFDIFETANPKDPKQIARKINFILKNKKKYIKTKSNLKKAFLEELNFEKQFEKSYKKIL